MARERIASIDTVRGVAVLGILLMNVIGMAFAGAAYLNPMYTGGAEPLNLALWAGAFIAVDGKMRALFAMLFGASLLLMSEGSAPGEAMRRHAARMAVLFVFGMLHGSLLWSGDILLPFALAGLAIWPLRQLAVPRLFVLGIVALALQAAINLMFGLRAISAEAAAARPDAPPQAIEAWESLRSTTWTAPEDLARETALYRGGLADILAIRHEAMLFARLFLLPFVFLIEAIGLMLIGMGLYRLGWWQGRFETRHYARVACLAIPLGWALGALLAARFHASGFAPATFFLTDAARVLVAPGVALGYAAAVIALVKAEFAPRLAARLAACGRMALSNYLLASILANLVFTGIGLGLYGTLSRAQAYLVVLAIWALQLGWSKPWLEHFRYGPFEWLWRSLARLERQPMHPPAYPRPEPG
jgi:uncharacterized protein